MTGPQTADTARSGIRANAVDSGLLFLRLSGSLLLMAVHGIPKLIYYSTEVAKIEDPLHIGRSLTIVCAIFAELVCPLFIIAGVGARIAALPVIFLTGIALTLVHREWSLAEGQFAWMLLIIFGTIAIAGPGGFSVPWRIARRSSTHAGR